MSSSHPCPWLAEITSGSPNPRPWKSADTMSASSPSPLLSTSVTGLPERRSSPATKWSWLVSPARASARKIRRSASATARSVCARICAARPTGFSTSPPVSMTTLGTGPRRAKPYWRSRVSPGTSATMASRVPVSTLNSVDLPTLGRPTSAMTGSMACALAAAVLPGATGVLPQAAACQAPAFPAPPGQPARKGRPAAAPMPASCPWSKAG